jgi:hypothetical protein
MIGWPSLSTPTPQTEYARLRHSRPRRPLLNPAVNTPLTKSPGSTARALSFSPICRTFSSGGTRRHSALRCHAHITRKGQSDSVRGGIRSWALACFGLLYFLVVGHRCDAVFGDDYGCCSGCGAGRVSGCKQSSDSARVERNLAALIKACLAWLSPTCRFRLRSAKCRSVDSGRFCTCGT